ncbi:MAG: hypothetical protein K9L82_07185 [Chromatiaceae bacterium]|nr:hypothetical protein [Chromatiaceae bacterium]
MALLLGRLAGDLGFSGNYLAAAFCIFGGLYLLDWLPLPQLGRGLQNRGQALGRAACGMMLRVVAGVLIDSA